MIYLLPFLYLMCKTQKSFYFIRKTIYPYSNRENKMRLRLFIILLTSVIMTNAFAQSVDTSTENQSSKPAVEVNGAPITQDNLVPNPENNSVQVPQYVEISVFTPRFMKSLLTCKTDIESDGERQIEILERQDDNCHLKYANFDLNIPMDILGNIHSFDDVETLLKNKDFATYNYRADYIYDGLMYALNACSEKKDYDGKTEELVDSYVTINRGLSAEFINNNCKVYIYNQQNIEGVVTDYGVTCTLSYKAVNDLKDYFKDTIEKYGEKRSFGSHGRIMVKREQQNSETHDVDIALMYYLQQNGYCQRNNQ